MFAVRFTYLIFIFFFIGYFLKSTSQDVQSMLFIVLGLYLSYAVFRPAKTTKIYIIHGNLEEVFTQVLNSLTQCQDTKKINYKTSKIDKRNHFIELKTPINFLSWGHMTFIKLDAIQKNSVEISITNELALGQSDLSNVNQKSISQIEKILNLQPSIPTHFMRDIQKN